MVRNASGQKKIRCDIARKNEDGELINVEMSFHPINHELKRLEYYTSRLFVGQDIEGIAMASETLCKITANEREYAILTSQIRGELDWRSGMKDARSEGHTEGLAEGRTEAHLEDTRKMKADNMPISQISKYTGLSAEIISGLQARTKNRTTNLFQVDHGDLPDTKAVR